MALTWRNFVTHALSQTSAYSATTVLYMYICTVRVCTLNRNFHVSTQFFILQSVVALASSDFFWRFWRHVLTCLTSDSSVLRCLVTDWSCSDTSVYRRCCSDMSDIRWRYFNDAHTFKMAHHETAQAQNGPKRNDKCPKFNARNGPSSKWPTAQNSPQHKIVHSTKQSTVLKFLDV
jgi:hypothetical protein